MMPAWNPTSQLNRLLTAIAVFAVIWPASAGTLPAASTDSALPGVAGDYHIAKTAPVPDADDQASGNGATFKIGDTDVRISGSVTVDVGAGSIKPAHR